MPEMKKLVQQSSSKPIAFNAQIVPRVIPFYQHQYGKQLIKRHIKLNNFSPTPKKKKNIVVALPLILHTCVGKVSACWSGTSPRVITGEVEQIRSIFGNKNGEFVHPLLNLLQLGNNN